MLKKTRKYEVCFLFQLAQDLDLLFPLMEELKLKNKTFCCLVLNKVIDKSPRILKALRSLDVDYTVASQSQFWRICKTIMFSQKIISAVETSARAHKFAHRCTKISRILGKKTFTLQHGFENIGLTYSDKEFPIEKISIASDSILIWGNASTLHKNISDQTRRKCTSVGCAKTYPSKAQLHFGNKFVVTFFENLHWNRYSNLYREQFLKDLHTLSETYPEIQFLLKSHHAGQWTTKNKKNHPKFLTNVMILDPTDPRWEPHTGPEYILVSNLIVTTPSTIACDAAVMGKPVVVAAYDLDLEAYKPLPLMRKIEDYCAVIEDVMAGNKGYQQYAEAFITKNLVNTSAAEKMVNLILSEI